MVETKSFELKKYENGLDIRFSSTLAHIDEVCTSVTQFMKSRGKNFYSHIFAVNLVVREGLTNAVRHGNKNDPDKMVGFRMEIDPSQTIQIRIQDQGDGFDWQAARQAQQFEQEDHGRGMPIMETYCDGYEYNSTGNVLFLVKEIPPDDGALEGLIEH